MDRDYRIAINTVGNFADVTISTYDMGQSGKLLCTDHGRSRIPTSAEIAECAAEQVRHGRVEGSDLAKALINV